MALTVDGDVITVDDSDPVGVAARVRFLEEQIAGMPADAVEAMSADIGRVQSWLSGVLAKVTTRSSTLQRQGQRSDPKKTAARAGLGDREAAQATRRADAMQQMPEALGALEDGDHRRGSCRRLGPAGQPAVGGGEEGVRSRSPTSWSPTPFAEGCRWRRSSSGAVTWSTG